MSELDQRNFVGIRHERIKTLGEGNPNIKGQGRRGYSGEGYGALGRWDHHVRESDTPNAEPAKFTRNRVWCADTKWRGIYCNRKDPKLARILKREYLADLTRATLVEKKVGVTSRGKRMKLRTDTVYLEELIVYISPAWFRHGDLMNPVDEERRGQFEKFSVEWLREKFGENLLVVISHGDEANPHLGAFVIPLVRKLIKAKGRVKADQPRAQWQGYVLNASAFFTGDILCKNGETIPGTCSLHQTELATHLPPKRESRQFLRQRR